MSKFKFKYLYTIFTIFILFGFFVGIIGFISVRGTIHLSIDINHISTFILIVTKNSLAVVTLLLTLIFGKSIIIAFFSINGFYIGLICSKLTIDQILVLLLPHGILEFLAYFLISKLIFNTIEANKSQIGAFDFFQVFLTRYSMLLLAAFIESFVTPALAEIFLRR